MVSFEKTTVKSAENIHLQLNANKFVSRCIPSFDKTIAYVETIMMNFHHLQNGSFQHLLHLKH